MKQLLILILISNVSLLFAQQNMEETHNKFSIGLSIGGADGHAPIRLGNPKLYQPTYVQGELRYMFNNRFGVMATLQYNNFKIGETGYRTNYMNAAIHGVINAGDLLKFGELTNNKFGLLIHGGFGLGSMWQKGFYDSLGIEPSSPYFKKADDMLVWSFGATPQFKINERIALHSDLSFYFHNKQTLTFDMQHPSNHGAIDGYFLTLSIGATYYIGKSERHLDWVPTKYGAPEVDLSSDEARVATLEKEIQSSKERTAQLEAEQLADGDSDGVPDVYDICPDLKGDWGGSGCPDSDGDRIPDHIDNCPDVYGSWKYKGCEVFKSEQVIVNPNDVRINDLIVNMDTIKRYHVIVGAFQNLNNATTLVAKLQSNLWKQSMIIGKRNELSLVGIGSFDNKEEALRVLDRARQEIIQTAWLLDLEKE